MDAATLLQGGPNLAITTYPIAQVYNDTLNDLLGTGRNMKLREGVDGVVIEGVTYEPVLSEEQVLCEEQDT